MNEQFSNDREQGGLTTDSGQPLPLTGVSIGATLAGPFVTATMVQRWTNQGALPVEALWRFPVPQDATVRSLVVERGGRRLVAQVSARDEAFDHFDRGIEDGSLAALLDAETEGLLAMRLGNLGAGESVLVELSWVSMLEESANLLRLRLPTAMAPRYFPASYNDNAQVNKRERLELPWASRVPYGISVDVDILEASDMVAVTSPSHELAINLSASPVRVRLGGDFARMDRDFVLDLKPKTNRPDRAWLERDGRGTWIGADIRIPDSGSSLERKVAILLDISGSMSGRSLEAARRTLCAGIASLGVQDDFGLFAFNNEVIAMDGSPRRVSDSSLALARAWVNHLQASGGTELLPALEQVYSSGTWSDVLVITDGDIGNDHEVALAAGRQVPAGTRTSLLGIGDAPALDALAAISRAGGGACATVHPGERLEARALSLFSEMLAARVENPALRVVNAGTVIAEPAAAIHVSTGSRLRCLARLDPDLNPENLEFSGTAGSQDISVAVHVVPVGQRAGGCGGLAALWARERVADILVRSFSVRRPEDARRLERQAVDLSIEAGILSTTASMVVVDATGQKSKTDAEFIEIPVLMPAGYGGGLLEIEPRQLNLSLRSTRYELTCSESEVRMRCQSPAPKILADIAFTTDTLYDIDPAADTDDAGGTRDADDETILYDLLALQLPGGGFGPEDEVLALLGNDSLEELAESLGLSCDSHGNDSVSRRKLLARLILTLLAKCYASLAAVWEPLVGASRVFAELSPPSSRAAQH